MPPAFNDVLPLTSVLLRVTEPSRFWMPPPPPDAAALARFEAETKPA
jgi:hypothetical protein